MGCLACAAERQEGQLLARGSLALASGLLGGEACGR